MRIRTAMANVQIPKTTPLSVHRKISAPLRKRIRAISSRLGIEAMIAGIHQSTNAS